MPFYKVKIRQEREWGGVIEADNVDDAITLAHLEAAFDTIVDEQTVIESLPEGEDDNDPGPYPPERDYVYYN